jgi:hypothetical protein
MRWLIFSLIFAIIIRFSYSKIKTNAKKKSYIRHQEDKQEEESSSAGAIKAD